MKPLYLTPSQPIRISLDGPSLLVREEGVAPRRFPLSRLTAIYLARGVSVASPILDACLARGIPIIFVAPDGAPSGFAIPFQPRPSSLRLQFEAFLARHDARSLYQNWFRATERREISSTLRRLRLRTPDLRAAPAARLLHQRLALTLPHSLVTPALDWLLSLCAGLAAQLAAQHDLPLNALSAASVHLLSDIASLLRWQLAADVVLSLPSTSALSSQPAVRRSFTALFESLRLREERRARALLDHFRLWLADLP